MNDIERAAKEKEMSELYAIWDSLDGDFRTGTKEEMKEAYEETLDSIMDYVNDGSDYEDKEVLLLKVVRRAEIVVDEERNREDDPRKSGYDCWVKWQDVKSEPRALTLDELRQMDGMPVKIYEGEKYQYGLVSLRGNCFTQEEVITLSSGDFYLFNDLTGNTEIYNVAYDHEPKEKANE